MAFFPSLLPLGYRHRLPPASRSRHRPRRPPQAPTRHGLPRRWPPAPPRPAPLRRDHAARRSGRLALSRALLPPGTVQSFFLHRGQVETDKVERLTLAEVGAAWSLVS